MLHLPSKGDLDQDDGQAEEQQIRASDIEGQKLNNRGLKTFSFIHTGIIIVSYEQPNLLL